MAVITKTQNNSLNACLKITYWPYIRKTKLLIEHAPDGQTMIEAKTFNECNRKF